MDHGPTSNTSLSLRKHKQCYEWVTLTTELCQKTGQYLPRSSSHCLWLSFLSSSASLTIPGAWKTRTKMQQQPHKNTTGVISTREIHTRTFFTHPDGKGASHGNRQVVLWVGADIVYTSSWDCGCGSISRGGYRVWFWWTMDDVSLKLNKMNEIP